MDNNIRDILETVNFIKDHMATKGDLQELRTELEEFRKEVREELKDIRRRLEVLETQTKNHAGFTKEIDHILSRVQVIEKHIGIIHQPNNV